MVRLLDYSPCYDNKLKSPCPNRNYCIEYGRSACVAYRNYEDEYKKAMESKYRDNEIYEYVLDNRTKLVDKAYKRHGSKKRIGVR